MGLGTWQSKPNEVADAVKVALKKGYRHIDTALAYANEQEVGQGIKESGVPRNEIWLTTKLDNTWHHRVTDGIDSSLKSLGTDYVDLYLMVRNNSSKRPSSTDLSSTGRLRPTQMTRRSTYQTGISSRHGGLLVLLVSHTWLLIPTREEMQKLPATGKVKNIGVSNFGIKNLEILLNSPSCKTVPAVNQIELHPNNPSPKLVAYCKEKGIHCTGYSCLGSTNSPLYRDPTLLKMADDLRKTPQQILLVWGVAKGWSVIPKSVNQTRVEKNFELDGWELSEKDMQALDNLSDRFKVCKDAWLPVKVFFGDDE